MYFAVAVSAGYWFRQLRRSILTEVITSIILVRRYVSRTTEREPLFERANRRYFENTLLRNYRGNSPYGTVLIF